MLFDTVYRTPHFLVISDSEMNTIKLNNAREDLKNLEDLEAYLNKRLAIVQDRIKEKLSIITQLEPPNESKQVPQTNEES